MAIAASFWDALRLKNVVVDHLEQAAQATRLPRLMGPRGCWSYEPLPGCWAQSQPLAEREVGVALHGQAPSPKGVASGPPPPHGCQGSSEPHDASASLSVLLQAIACLPSGKTQVQAATSLASRNSKHEFPLLYLKRTLLCPTGPLISGCSPKVSHER